MKPSVLTQKPSWIYAIKPPMRFLMLLFLFKKIEKRPKHMLSAVPTNFFSSTLFFSAMIKSSLCRLLKKNGCIYRQLDLDLRGDRDITRLAFQNFHLL